MQVLASFLVAYGLVMVCILALWTLSVRLRDASIIDMFWGAGFGLIAILLYAQNRPEGAYGLVMALMPSLWAIRFTVYIVRRNRGQGEDSRYSSLRKRFDGDAAFARYSLTHVYLLQGHIMVLVASPIIVALSLEGSAPLPGLLWLGTLLWLAGTICEAVADAQLRAFRSDPANRGKVLAKGLWRYSRHPNYFGNALLWWGIFVAACAHPWALPTVIAPAVMTYFLVKVTGAALLDKKLAREKPGYAEYMARTSGFVPMPPRETKA